MSVVQLLKSKDRPLDSAAEQLERCGLDWKHRKEQLFKIMHRAHKVHNTNKVLFELFTKIGLYSDKDCTKIDWYLDLFKALTSMSGPLCRCAVRLLLGILSRFNE